jgi:hypothetical protein
MPTKKIIICILITVIIFEILFGPFNAGKTNAGFPPLISDVRTMSLPETIASFMPALGGAGTVIDYLNKAVYIIVWTPAAWLMRVGGGILDFGISFSISGPLFRNLAKGEAVNKGWQVSRDIVNLFLIFILLYIAIATILQISGYGAKELLATLIIIAFLVNFSLVITRLIIDASNVLTTGFYSQFNKNDKGEVSVSLTFARAFDFEKIVSETEGIETAKSPVLPIVRLLSYLFGTVIMVIAGFIFAIFGALFLIRMVVLLLLMILAPLAFAGHILPSTKKLASKWWDTLFSQAFFAPIALFLLWFSAYLAIANRDTIKGLFDIGDKGISDMVAMAMRNKSSTPIIGYFVGYIFVAFFLCASLVMAKSMGAVGAEVVQKGFLKAGKKVQGYAGRIGRRYAAASAERLATSKGAFARTIRAIPLATRGLARVSAGAKAEVAEYEKKYDSYSTNVLKNLSTQFGTNPSARMAMLNILTKRGKLEDYGKFNKQFIKTVMTRAEGIGISPKDIIRKRPDVATDMEEAAKAIRSSDIAELHDPIINELSDKKGFFDQAVISWSPGHIQEIVKKGGEIYKGYMEALKRQAGGKENITDIAKALAEKNASTARWLESEAGTSLLGFKTAKETPPETPPLPTPPLPTPPSIEIVSPSGGGKRTPEQQRRMEELRRGGPPPPLPPPTRPPLAPPPTMPPPPKIPPASPVPAAPPVPPGPRVSPRPTTPPTVPPASPIPSASAVPPPSPIPPASPIPPSSKP